MSLTDRTSHLDKSALNMESTQVFLQDNVSPDPVHESSQQSSLSQALNMLLMSLTLLVVHCDKSLLKEFQQENGRRRLYKFGMTVTSLVFHDATKQSGSEFHSEFLQHQSTRHRSCELHLRLHKELPFGCWARKSTCESCGQSSHMSILICTSLFKPSGRQVQI